MNPFGRLLLATALVVSSLSTPLVTQNVFAADAAKATSVTLNVPNMK